MANHFLILNFHGLGEPRRRLLPDEQRVWLEPSAFESWLTEAQSNPQVKLTLDDGNTSDFEIALPLLRAHQVIAQFFVCAGHLDRHGYLAVAQLKELVSAGMTIGNHGMRHRDWRQLGEAEETEEWVASRKRLEDVLQTPVTDAACPFGSYDRKVLRSLRRAGYQRVYTSDGGWAAADAWLCPRNSIWQGDSPVGLRRPLNASPFGGRALLLLAKRLFKRVR